MLYEVITDLILQSTYNNLVVFEKTPTGIIRRNRIEGFADLVRYIEFDHLRNLWASHMHRGIYRIRLDDERQNCLQSTYYGIETFGKDDHIHVFKVENRIVFTTGDEIFTFDDLQDTIIPYTELNNKIGSYNFV